MPSHNLDIDERDLTEAPRLPKDAENKGMMIALAVAAVLFLALLVYGSLPDLSPEDIISMDGYEGEQPTKYIFNIHSLEKQAEQSTAAKDSADAPQATVLETAVTEPVIVETVKVKPATVETAVVEPVAVVTEELPILQPEPEPVPTIADTAPQEVVQPAATTSQNELPLAVTEPVPNPVVRPVVTPVAISPEPVTSLFSTAPQEKVVAAMATTPTIDEADDTVVISSVVAVEPVPVPVSAPAPASTTALTSIGSGQRDSQGKLLPLRSVLTDGTELKSSPSAQSETVLSLGQGVVLTAFERHGKWIHVGTNDGSSVTGYVLETSLGRVGTKTSG